MTKNIFYIGSFAALVSLAACSADGNNPGRSYAPDMVYSTAYETYAPAQERLKASGATYSHMPVAGTVARGELPAYDFKNDSAGYAQSASVANPLPAGSVDMKNAERLYLINCAICHGAKLDGNGPLYKGGDGPYTAAPKDLLSAELKAMPEGQMFHSVTYGKNMMGSYASQMTSKQRWMVIAYIKNKQGVGAVPVADSVAAVAAPVVDGAATK